MAYICRYGDIIDSCGVNTRDCTVQLVDVEAVSSASAGIDGVMDGKRINVAFRPIGGIALINKICLPVMEQVGNGANSFPVIQQLPAGTVIENALDSFDKVTLPVFRQVDTPLSFFCTHSGIIRKSAIKSVVEVEPDESLSLDWLTIIGLIAALVPFPRPSTFIN